MNNNIIILGAGIVGTLCALSLAKAGIKTTIIERKSLAELQTPDDLRTTALSKTSQEILAKIGVWESLTPFTETIEDIYVCQNMEDNILHFGDKNSAMGFMITNIDLRATLTELALTCPLIELKTGYYYQDIELQSDKVKLTLKSSSNREYHEELIADLCLVCDGKFSNAKKQFFTNKIEKDYQQKAIIFNIEHSLHHEGGALEHFLPRGPFATLPLKGGYHSGVVWSEASHLADFWQTRTNEEIAEVISRFTGGSLGKIKVITPPQAYPLSAYVSDHYHKGRLVLVADSAHLIHPLAGQGLNIGIKDIKTITELVIKRLAIGLRPDELMLEEYSRLRKFDNFLMFKITDVINGVFSRDFWPLNKLTSLGLGVVENLPFIKEGLRNYAAGKRKII